jgi:hypothetical protein
MVRFVAIIARRQRHSIFKNVSSPSQGTLLQRKPVLDELFSICDVDIPAYISYNDVVFYQVSILAVNGAKWDVSKRYSDFFALQEKIQYFFSLKTGLKQLSPLVSFLFQFFFRFSFPSALIVLLDRAKDPM